MLVSRPLIVDGAHWGTVYTLEFKGDIFPLHTHSENDNHITILAHGSMRVEGHERYHGAELRAEPGGTILNWVAGEPHGFVALEDGTTLINLFKRRPAADDHKRGSPGAGA